MAQNTTSDHASTTSTNPSSNSVPDLLTEAGFTTARRRKRTGARHRRKHVPIGPHPPLWPRETTWDLNTPALDPDHLGEGVRFVLRKELKNSDVGPLGRIVLPKREAEAHLPVLTAREGFLLPMIDMETSQVWDFRYRFWPNNKSRMYILESTGDFVRAHDLHLGDFIMIYKDDERDRYIIRAKKATEQVQMALSVAPPTYTEDGIFDSIVPEIVVASARYSDLYLPWGVDGCVNMGAFGLNYAFSADIPLTFPDDIFGSSSASTVAAAAAPPPTGAASAAVAESAPTPRLGSIQKLSLDDLP